MRLHAARDRLLPKDLYVKLVADYSLVTVSMRRTVTGPASEAQCSSSLRSLLAALAFAPLVYSRLPPIDVPVDLPRVTAVLLPFFDAMWLL
jgi:hypothetical protein